MLLADEILLASHFPHKQAPAVRILFIFWNWMKEAMWNKINSGKVEQSLTFRAGPGLGGGFEVDVPCFSSTLFLVVIGLLFVLVVALFLVVQLDQQLGRFLERTRSYLLHASLAKTIFGYSFFLPHAHHVNENCSETSWHTKDLNIVNKWRSWRWDMWKYCRGIKKFSSTCGSSLQGDHMINNSQWLLKSWRQSQLEDAGEADMEKQIFHLCNSNTFWEMKKTFLLKVHVFFLAKRNSWRNIIARVATGDKLWLEKNYKVYLDSDLPHLLAGGAPDLGCCLASLPKTIFA